MQVTEGSGRLLVLAVGERTEWGRTMVMDLTCGCHALLTENKVMQVTEGSGRLLVLAVGERSEWGRTMALVASVPTPTPLQATLGVLARRIAKIGLAIGVLCFVVLLVRWAAHQHTWV